MEELIRRGNEDLQCKITVPEIEIFKFLWPSEGNGKEKTLSSFMRSELSLYI